MQTGGDKFPLYPNISYEKYVYKIDEYFLGIHMMKHMIDIFRMNYSTTGAFQICSSKFFEGWVFLSFFA